MTTSLAALADVVGGAVAMCPDGEIESLPADALLLLHASLGQARRLMDAAQTRVASEIARQSRPEMGSGGLAKQQGFRNPTVFIAATMGTTAGEAARLVQVGEATAPRMTFGGEAAPARHPHVAEALASGRIGAHAASVVVTMLDRVGPRASREALDEAEHRLVAQAPGLTHDQLSKIVLRAEAFLDPNGVERREDELRAERWLTFREGRDGSLDLSGRFDPAGGAPIKAALEALVAADLRAQRNAVPSGSGSEVVDPDAPRRSVRQMQADALTRLAEHALGCDRRDLPLAGATIVVRIALDDLVNGTGHATIDGISTPVSVATARRMAAGGSIIPCVLGGDSEILDWGRARRLFSDAQRLALAERDGGCAMCGAPPSHTKAHHLRWWARDAGPTDLANGVLLCESCHHRIHDNGWEIRIDGPGTRAKVWFIPPAHVDPARTPRLGGRARFDYAPAA
ncbi:HNH endonuclease signature motif containing protein [Microbacterium sp. SS28]|uniref:HNH endonuclease n=1 Tax=Microbacterium sp. SS28 TaxID=2919948 RepID=UPI001FAA161B|nr:HNH endonuclease signature motif containing protein [Microbacterium sp. SS28]